jgi:hypothetical protein
MPRAPAGEGGVFSPSTGLFEVDQDGSRSASILITIASRLLGQVLISFDFILFQCRLCGAHPGVI